MSIIEKFRDPDDLNKWIHCRKIESSGTKLLSAEGEPLTHANNQGHFYPLGLNDGILTPIKKTILFDNKGASLLGDEDDDVFRVLYIQNGSIHTEPKHMFFRNPQFETEWGTYMNFEGEPITFDERGCFTKAEINNIYVGNDEEEASSAVIWIEPLE